MLKENYVGKEVIGLSSSMVSDVEYIDLIIDVDDLGFTVKRVGKLRKKYTTVSRYDKVWVREEDENHNGEIHFYSHYSKYREFTFLDSIKIGGNK